MTAGVKRTVVIDDLREADIRPSALFDQYLALSAVEAARLFDQTTFVAAPCPACNGERRDEGFEKNGFRYARCADCGTVYVSPRPTQPMLASYERDSRAGQFWREHFYAETAAARRVRLFQPRAEWIATTVETLNLPPTLSFVDVGSGYGAALEEIAKLGIFSTIAATTPRNDVESTCSRYGFLLLPKSAESGYRATVATAFEVIERVFDPRTLFARVNRLLVDGGLFFVTTISASGLDLQILWEKSRSVFPPDHINLLSIEGVHILAETNGFEVVELSTPGQLDVEIVLEALEGDPTVRVPRFVEYLLKHRGRNTHLDLQDFLQRHLLSSHLRAVLRKRGDGNGHRT